MEVCPNRPRTWPDRIPPALAPAARRAVLLAFGVGSLGVGSLGVGCVAVETRHQIEPIHITMDVNVRLEQELEDAFSGLDARAQEIAAKRNTEGGTE